MILEAAETKELPPMSLIPSFNDDMVEDRIMSILELVTGKEYKK